VRERDVGIVASPMRSRPRATGCWCRARWPCRPSRALAARARGLEPDARDARISAAVEHRVEALVLAAALRAAPRGSPK
jgi:hypothetical protein